jgi:hypothetical protein
VSSWIFILVVYALGLGIFCLLGGFGAAGDALRRWGAASVGPRADRASSGT